VDWLERPRPKGNYGYNEFFNTIDTILWGRKTFEPLLKSGDDPAKFGPKAKNYVFSHDPPGGPVTGAEFVKEPIETFAPKLRTKPGKHIWMMGGAGIIASFLDAGEIDEFIIHVIPILIGEGIPLIAPRHRTVRLHLLDATTFPDGVVRLHYSVSRPEVAPPKRVRPKRTRKSH
ncbi:MAG TPA: dihydrofolate reductase family protein, partial [Candidatus Acidoferrales bacterium]|nr:dihydrofolate reductase family protein [Candidatus Acidoferrales bacterium]